MKLKTCLYEDWPCDLKNKDIEEFCDRCITWVIKNSTWDIKKGKNND